MAMAGSAIGLGNIWRFPYMVGRNGGAVFIIVYLLAVVLLCVPIFLSESVIGKRAQLSTVGAMDKLAPGTPWKYIGLFTFFAPIILVSYYSVVGGWSIAYQVRALSFAVSDTAMTQAEHSARFGGFIASTWTPLIWHTVFIGITALIVRLGIRKGVEQFTKTTTPLLFVLILAIMTYSLTLPGAKAGVDYLLKPDFSKLTGETMLSAMGQAFYSLSLGVGCILTYSSYMKRGENMLATGVGTAVFDLMFALLAGFAIMPAVFAAGIEPGAGPGLIFETLPYIFSSMGQTHPVISHVISILFFTTIVFAALTSSVSMLETCVAFLVDEKKWPRKRATLVLFLVCWGIGVLCSLSFGPLKGVHLLSNTIFEFCDKLISNFVMTLGSLLFVIFVGWKMKKADVYDEFTCGGRLRTGKMFNPIYFLIRWVAPIMIIAIFMSNILL